MDKSKELCGLIKNINIHDDSIIVTHHIKTFSQIFCKSIKSTEVVQKLFEKFNENALTDSKFAVNLAVVMSSRQLDNMEVEGDKIRHMMIKILQNNFNNSEKYKAENVHHFYNSITLLGEYFNKVKLSNGSPIHVLGKALLDILKNELEMETQKCLDHPVDSFEPELANLILTQITLNGQLVRIEHKLEMTNLLLAIRKCLINIPNLSRKTKAFFLMTLDLYYSNFTTLGSDIESLYTGFFAIQSEDNKLVNKSIIRYQNDCNLHENGVNGVNTNDVETQTVVNKSSIACATDDQLKVNKEIQTNGEITEEPKEESAVSGNGPVETVCSATKCEGKTGEETAEVHDEPTDVKENDNTDNKSESNEENFNENKLENRTEQEHENINAIHSIPDENIDTTKTCDDLNEKNHQPIVNVEIVTRDSKSIKDNNSTLSTALTNVKADNENELMINQNGKAIPSMKNEIKVKSSDSCSDSSSSLNSISTDSDNVLKQNKRIQRLPEPVQKNGINHKVYFREENAENLTWDTLELEEEFETPSQTACNPYSSQFLNFLGNN